MDSRQERFLCRVIWMRLLPATNHQHNKANNKTDDPCYCRRWQALLCTRPESIKGHKMGDEPVGHDRDRHCSKDPSFQQTTAKKVGLRCNGLPTSGLGKPHPAGPQKKNAYSKTLQVSLRGIRTIHMQVLFTSKPRRLLSFS